MDFQASIVERFADAGEPLLAAINRAAAAARANGIQVIYVRVAFRPGAPEVDPNNRAFGALAGSSAFSEDSPGARIHPAVAPQPSDIVVTKKRVSAFAGSDLDMVLRSRGVRTLVLAGIATSGVVPSTLRQAADLDYALVVLRDGCVDADEEVHRVLLEKVFARQADVLTVDEWIGGIGHGSRGQPRRWKVERHKCRGGGLVGHTHRMRLTSDECWSSLRSAEHGVLCTTNARRTIDAVPVCFAIVSDLIVTPIDRVKDKDTTKLGRLKNLDRDARATLLCDHWNLHDWSRLWWVRAHLSRRSGHDVTGALLHEGDGALRDKYVQYRDTDFAELLFFDVGTLVGWCAAGAQLEETDPLM